MKYCRERFFLPFSPLSFSHYQNGSKLIQVTIFSCLLLVKLVLFYGTIFCAWRNLFLFLSFFFNWDSLHARWNIHDEAWSYKKKKNKKIKAYSKSDSKETTIAFIIFSEFLKFYQISFQQKWNNARVSGT